MERRDIDPAVARLHVARPTNFADEPSLLREPARALVAVGSIVAIASSIMPWAARTRIVGDETRNGWQGVGDGFLITVVAIVLCVLAFNRSAIAAKTQIVRRLPAILAVVAMLLWASGVRTMEGAIATWRRQGYDGEFQPWLFVCLVGVLMLAAGGLWIGTRPGPKRTYGAGRVSGRTAAVGTARVSGSTLGSVAFESIGGIVGVIATNGAIIAFTADWFGTAVVMPLFLGTFLGALVGARLGARLWNVLGRSAGQ